MSSPTVLPPDDEESFEDDEPLSVEPPPVPPESPFDVDVESLVVADEDDPSSPLAVRRLLL